MPGTRRGCGASGTWAATRRAGARSISASTRRCGARAPPTRCLWTMQSYFPNGEVTAEPYAGPTKIPLEPEPIFSRKKGEKHEVVATYDAEFRAGFDRKITEWATRLHGRGRRRRASRSTRTCPTRRCTSRRSPTRSTPARPSAGTGPTSSPRWTTSPESILDKLDELGHRGRHDRRLGLRQRRRHHLPLPGDRPGSGGRSMARVLGAVARRPVHRARGVEPDALHRAVAGEGARREGQQRARARGRLVHDAAERRRREGPRRPDHRRHGHDATSCSARPRSRVATSSCTSRGTGSRRPSGTSGRSICSSRTTSTRPGRR